MKNKELKKSNIVMHAVIILVAIVLGCLLSKNSYEIAKTYKKNINLKTNYVLEYATIVEFKERHSKNGSHYYTTYYEYIAPDNTKYTGIADLHIYDKDEAEAQIGKKVSIYIDHDLHLQADSPNPRPKIGGAWFCGAAAVICFAVALNSLVRIIRWQVVNRKLNNANCDSKE